MSNPSEMLHLHINDLQDILAIIALDKSANVESVWHEVWDCILNHWTRRTSDGTTRLSVAPQRQITREMLVGGIEGDVDHGWSYETDPGDTSTVTEGSHSPPSVQQRIDEACAGIHTESRIPDFVVFALRRHSLPYRRLVCIVEIKAHTDTADIHLPIVAPQIITQAKFAFDAFPDLRHVFSIVAFGVSWSMYRFPRDELTRLYINKVEGYGDNDTFDPSRPAKQPKTVDISEFIVVPISQVLKADGSNYSSAFEKAIGLITAELKARVRFIEARVEILKLFLQ